MHTELSIGIERRETIHPWAAAARPLRLGSAAAGLKRSFVEGTIFLPLIAVALWALTHSFQGILGDASVYIGRALADLHPSGMGQDIMFVNDGQSRFSLFPLLLDHLVGAVGTEPTAILLAFASMAAWIAALSAYARQFVAWRFVAVVVIFVAVLPVCYGSLWRFGYSEILAVPRPFAEALVLGGLAALTSGRTWLSFVILVAASLVHPLMALAGWSVFGLVLGRESWRWRFALALSVLLFVACAALGVPVLDRLFTYMDLDLKAFAESRSPLLFPTLWAADFLGPIAVQTATIIIAARLFDGRRRAILLATILVGIGGIAAAALFGDRLGLLLVIQAQLWRMAWLLAATGSIALAIAAINLWHGGPRANIVLALLSMAWLSYDNPVCAVALSGIAVLIGFGTDKLASPLSARLTRGVWACAIVWGLFWNLHYIISFWHFIAAIPANGSSGLGYFFNRRFIAFPIGAIALALAMMSKRSAVIWALECALALILIVGAIRFWDDRSSFQRLLDANRHPPELMQMLARRNGEVLWIDGLTEAWFLTGRPQWASPQQGVSTIFSPALARTWRERTEFLIHVGLAEEHALSALHIPATRELPTLSRAGITQLCARADAPAWIVAPIRDGTVVPAGLKPQYWRAPHPAFRMTADGDHYDWHKTTDYAVLACAKS